jgi:hypothetical protein
MACRGGGGGGGGGAPGGLAPGVTAGSSGERGRVTFQLSSSEQPGMVLLHVGKETGSYDTTFELTDIKSMGAVSTAIEPGFSDLLAQPDVYFVALTVVDQKGRESDFSNEILVDTRESSSGDGQT